MKKAFGILSCLILPFAMLCQDSLAFAVDLSETISCGLFNREEGDTLLVRGTFNGWTGNDWWLEDPDGDEVYRGYFDLQADTGTAVEYKYVIRKADGKELWEKKPDPGNPPNGNRQYAKPPSSQQAEVVLFDFDRYYLGVIGKPVMFSVEELQEDFGVFRETLEKEHCCLYDFTSKESFDSLFNAQYKLIDRPMRPNEFYRLLTPVTARVGCGHTAAWMPGGYWEIAPKNLFPLQVRLITGRTIKFRAVEEYLVVEGAYTDSLQVPVGSVILEINGRPAWEIILEMRQNYSADAFNPYFIDAQIARRFPLIYARRFGFPEKYEVHFALPGRKTSETKLLEPATNTAVREVVFRNFHHPPLTFKIFDEDRAALLAIPTFIYYDRVPYFTGFIDSCFAEIREKKIEYLILDVRGNDGGDPFCAAPLFAYLQPEPLPYFAEPYGKYADLAEPLPLPENHFTGELITLMDGRCFSTNAHFCALLKHHQIGTFIGTPSGGTYTCNAGKNTIKVLPNTQIQLYFGRSSFAVAVQGMDKAKPIAPDHYVPETYNNFLTGKDQVMNKAFQLIEGKSKQPGVSLQ